MDRWSPSPKYVIWSLCSISCPSSARFKTVNTPPHHSNIPHQCHHQRAMQEESRFTTYFLITLYQPTAHRSIWKTAIASVITRQRCVWPITTQSTAELGGIIKDHPQASTVLRPRSILYERPPMQTTGHLADQQASPRRLVPYSAKRRSENIHLKSRRVETVNADKSYIISDELRRNMALFDALPAGI